MASSIKEAMANAIEHKQNTEEVLDLIADKGVAKIPLGKEGDYVAVSVSSSGKISFDIIDK